MGRPLFNRSRVVAVILLLVSVWGLPHRPLDDDACLPVTEGEHDASKHVFAPLTGVEADEHCAVCHWMRGLKPTFASVARVSAPLLDSTAFAASTTVPTRAPAGAHLPPRAPPAA